MKKSEKVALAVGGLAALLILVGAVHWYGHVQAEPTTTPAPETPTPPAPYTQGEQPLTYAQGEECPF